MSTIEAVMTPEQAAAAAYILQARSVAPIHFHAMHKPPMYIETQEPLKRLEDHLNNLAIGIVLHQPGDWFELS